MSVYDDIQEERKRADEKHGENSMNVLPADSDRWLGILTEELGEVAHDMTYDGGGTTESLRAELVQVAAVAAAWVDAIDRAGKREAEYVYVVEERDGFMWGTFKNKLDAGSAYRKSLLNGDAELVTYREVERVQTLPTHSDQSTRREP